MLTLSRPGFVIRPIGFTAIAGRECEHRRRHDKDYQQRIPVHPDGKFRPLFSRGRTQRDVHQRPSAGAADEIGEAAG